MADRLIVAHGNGLRSAPMVLSCHRITIPEKDVNHHGDQWDPVPSHEILDFFFFSFLPFSLLGLRYTLYRIVEYCTWGVFRTVRRWKNEKEYYFFFFEVSFLDIHQVWNFFLIQKKLINFWLGLTYCTCENK